VLLGADEIARQPATLVLVQRPPGGGRSRRAHDTEVSDSLALARELIDAGVEELMVLPAMNPAESRAILVALARLAGDRPDPEPPAHMAGLVGHVHRILDEVDPAIAADVIALVRVQDLAS
jgi:hypothetical protein